MRWTFFAPSSTMGARGPAVRRPEGSGPPQREGGEKHGGACPVPERARPAAGDLEGAVCAGADPERARHSGADQLHGHAVHRRGHGGQPGGQGLGLHRPGVHLHLAAGGHVHLPGHRLFRPGGPPDRGGPGGGGQERAPAGPAGRAGGGSSAVHGWNLHQRGAARLAGGRGGDPGGPAPFPRCRCASCAEACSSAAGICAPPACSTPSCVWRTWCSTAC